MCVCVFLSCVFCVAPRISVFFCVFLSCFEHVPENTLFLKISQEFLLFSTVCKDFQTCLNVFQETLRTLFIFYVSKD